MNLCGELFHSDSECHKKINKKCRLITKISKLTQINDPSGYPFPLNACTLSFPQLANPPFEPYLAVHPKNPKILVACWLLGTDQPAAITFDGGKTWINTLVPLSICLGGFGFTNGIIDGGSLGITDDDTVIRSDLFIITQSTSTTVTTLLTGASVTRGKIDKTRGIIWETPQIVFQGNTGQTILGGLNNSQFTLVTPVDKQLLFVDPKKNDIIYNIWHTQVSNVSLGIGEMLVYLARSVNGGTTWETARVIYEPSNDPSIQSNINPSATPGANDFAPLALKKLICKNRVIFLMKIQYTDITGTNIIYPGIISSENYGLNWTQNSTRVAPNFNGFNNVARIGIDPDKSFVDPNYISLTRVQGFRTVRIQGGGNSLDINQETETLYVVYTNGVNATLGLPPLNDTSPPISLALSQVNLVLSRNGGKTWSDPIVVSQTSNQTVSTPGANQAMSAMIAVLPNGILGIFYYDFRFYTGMAGSPLLTDAWLAIYEDKHGKIKFREEIRLTDVSFDARKVNPVNRMGYGFGEYFGITAGENNTFHVAFIRGNDIAPIVSIPPGPPFPRPDRYVQYELQSIMHRKIKIEYSD